MVLTVVVNDLYGVVVCCCRNLLTRQMRVPTLCFFVEDAGLTGLCVTVLAHAASLYLYAFGVYLCCFKYVPIGP